MEVTFTKAPHSIKFDIQKIIQRRTLRSNYIYDLLKRKDIEFLLNNESDFLRYIPNSTKEHQWLNEQTIIANRIQAYRDEAEKELSNWIHFSSKEAKSHCDGLTTESMELEGLSAWYLRNFYGKEDVMKNSFREKSIAIHPMSQILEEEAIRQKLSGFIKKEMRKRI